MLYNLSLVCDDYHAGKLLQTIIDQTFQLLNLSKVSEFLKMNDQISSYLELYHEQCIQMSTNMPSTRTKLVSMMCGRWILNFTN